MPAEKAEGADLGDHGAPGEPSVLQEEQVVASELGQRVLAGGDSVVFGVRDPKAGVDVPAGARVAAPSDAASGADVVIFAVPAGALVDAAKGAGDLSGKVVIDCTNPCVLTAPGRCGRHR